MKSIENLRRNELIAAVGRLAAYAGITAVAALATFLTTPILVRSLGLKGFGSYSLLEPLLISAASVTLLGADHGLLKKIAYDHDDIRTSMGAVLPLMTPILAVAGLAAAFIIPRVTDAGVASIVFAVLVPAEALLLFLTTGFRASDRIGAYAVAQGGRALLILSLIFSLARVVGPARASVASVVTIRTGVAVTLVLAFLVVVKPALRINWPEYRDGFRYGIFVVITSALSAFQENFDRYVIAGAAGKETVGAYVVCIKVAAIVGQSVILPLMIWFPAERLRHIKDPDGGKRFFGATTVGILSLLLTVSGSVYLCGKQLVVLIGPGTPYNPSVLGLLLIAGVATGMAHPLNIGLFKPGFSHYNMYPTAIASIVGLCLASAWVLTGGLVSVAGARAISTIFSATLICILSQRAHRCTLDFVRMACMVLLSALLLIFLTSEAASSLALWLKVGLFALTLAAASATILYGILRRDSKESFRDVGVKEALVVE
jgi:O-antigen/teichoic acid export membrane protein